MENESSCSIVHSDPEFWSKLSSKTLKSGKIMRKTALKTLKMV